MNRTPHCMQAVKLSGAVLAALVGFGCGGSQSDVGSTPIDEQSSYEDPPAYEAEPASEEPVQPEAVPDQGAPPPAQPAPGHEGAMPGADAGDVSEREVEVFSSLQVRLIQMQKSYNERAQAGEDPQELQSELNARVVQTIEGSGMSTSRFEQIARAVMADQQLRDQVDAAIQARL